MIESSLLLFWYNVSVLICFPDKEDMVSIIGVLENKKYRHRPDECPCCNKDAIMGIEVLGARMMLANRLDRENHQWSLLFDFGGMFNRWEYLP